MYLQAYLRQLSDSVVDLTDSALFLADLDHNIFPETSGLQVHDGFGASYARYMSNIWRAIRPKSTISIDLPEMFSLRPSRLFQLRGRLM